MREWERDMYNEERIARSNCSLFLSLDEDFSIVYRWWRRWCSRRMGRRRHNRSIVICNVRFSRQSNHFQMWMMLVVVRHRMGLFGFLAIGFRTTMKPIGQIKYLTEGEHDLQKRSFDSALRHPLPAELEAYLGWHGFTFDDKDMTIVMKIATDRQRRGRRRLLLMIKSRRRCTGCMRDTMNEPLLTRYIGKIA